MKKSDFVIKDWKEILKSKKIDFILTKDQLKKILKKIGNQVDEEGFIIDSKTKEPVKSTDLMEIQLNELGAVLPSSKVFVRNNIASFFQYLSEVREP